MKSITLFLKNNRVLVIYNLKKLSILYYPTYELYGLYYSDNFEPEKLIYSSKSFSQLLKLEEQIATAYKNGIANLSIK